MLKAGDILRDRYRIERHIKKGGMGSVYEALDQNLGHKVAIKYTDTINNKFSESTIKKLRIAFEREARLLSKLRHPNLPIATDYFEEDNSQYLVMDYIEGEDLEQQLKNQGAPFSVEQVLQWADDLLDTLRYLHGQQKPLIHRDIKPANLKVTATGKMMLLDFGLAKGGLAEESGGTIVYGKTLGYSPPEQIALKTTNERSDLYALSATLYYLLTAKRPIDAKLRQDAAENDVADPLKPANKLNPQVPAALAKVLASGMALEPNQRPANAPQMQAMLNDSVVLATIQRASNTKPKKRRHFSRFKSLALVAIGLLLSLLPILAIAVSPPTTPTPLPASTTTSISVSHTPVVTSSLTNTPAPPAPTTSETITPPTLPTVTRRVTLTSVITTTMPTVTEVAATAPATEQPSPSPPTSTPVVEPTIPPMTPPPTETVEVPISATPEITNSPPPPPTSMPVVPSRTMTPSPVGSVRVPISPTSEATDSPPPTKPPPPTSTPPPTHTSPPPPPPTSTSAPAATNTPLPTNTSAPAATNTPAPTNTSPPAATNTPAPTNTSPPAATNTPAPTNTSPPAATNTPLLTSTPSPPSTNTPMPTSIPTITPVPTSLPRVLLLTPENEYGCNKGASITFTWSWGGNLAGNAAPTYRVIILKDNAEVHRFDTSETSYTWTCNLDPSGYEWYVLVLNAGSPIEQTKSEWRRKLQITGGSSPSEPEPPAPICATCDDG